MARAVLSPAHSRQPTSQLTSHAPPAGRDWRAPLTPRPYQWTIYLRPLGARRPRRTICFRSGRRDTRSALFRDVLALAACVGTACGLEACLVALIPNAFGTAPVACEFNSLWQAPFLPFQTSANWPALRFTQGQ